MIKFKKGMKKVVITLMIVAMVISVVPLSDVFAGSDVSYRATSAKIVDVTYKFKSETAGKSIPDEVEKLKPKNEVSYEGKMALPTDPTAKTYKATDGTWNFKGWDKQSVQVGPDDVVFTGSWEFVPNDGKKYDVSYEFFVQGTVKELPKEVKDLLPPKSQAVEGTKLKAPVISKKTVKDEANDGTWTFVGWANDEITVNKGDVIFLGSWTFAPKTYKALHKFESATKGKKLPNEILKRVPSDKNNLIDKEVVEPKDFDAKDFNDGNGVWKFLGWSPKTTTVNKGNVYFVGKWEYKESAAPQPQPKMYNVVHKFESKTPGVALDKEIMDRLPADKTIEDGKTAMPTDFNKESIKTQKGTWTFEGWDADSKKVKGADVTFTGVWEFTETKKPENKPENKPNEPGQKPESGKDMDGKKPEIKTPDTKKPESKKPPKTADNSGIGVVLAALAISGTGIFGFVSKKRKNK